MYVCRYAPLDQIHTDTAVESNKDKQPGDTKSGAAVATLLSDSALGEMQGGWSDMGQPQEGPLVPQARHELRIQHSYRLYRWFIDLIHQT